MKIAIYGGAFNPVHKGHIEIVKQINEKYKFEAKVESGNAENDEPADTGEEEMGGADDLLGTGDEGDGDEGGADTGGEESDETGGLDSEILNSDVSPE